MQKFAIEPAFRQVSSMCRSDWKRVLTKTLVIMKLTAVLLTAAFLQVHATGKAQSVTLSGKDLSLQQVFAAIGLQRETAIG